MDAKPSIRTWTRDGFIISTDPSLIPRDSLNDALASDMCYWCTALPKDALEKSIHSSLCFGLYSPTGSLPPQTRTPDATEETPADVVHEIAGHVHPAGALHPNTATQNAQEKPDTASAPSLIGFARLITDNVTLCYLTDVYTLPAWQGQGLGTWLIQCVQETIDELPHLRRSLALTRGGERTVNWYNKLMKMRYIERKDGGPGFLEWRGPGSVV